MRIYRKTKYQSHPGVSVTFQHMIPRRLTGCLPERDLRGLHLRATIYHAQLPGPLLRSRTAPISQRTEKTGDTAPETFSIARWYFLLQRFWKGDTRGRWLWRGGVPGEVSKEILCRTNRSWAWCIAESFVSCQDSSGRFVTASVTRTIQIGNRSMRVR